MSEIRLQLVEAASPTSRLIGRYGGGGWAPSYSHVDCITSKGELVGARNDVINGVAAGVQIRPQGYETWIHRDVYTLVVTDGQAARWDEVVYAGIGAKYDEDAILSFVTGLKLHTKGEFICSAFATSCISLIGAIPVALPFEFQAYSPNAVAFGLSYLGATVVRNDR